MFFCQIRSRLQFWYAFFAKNAILGTGCSDAARTVEVSSHWKVKQFNPQNTHRSPSFLVCSYSVLFTPLQPAPITSISLHSSTKNHQNTCRLELRASNRPLIKFVWGMHANCACYPYYAYLRILPILCIPSHEPYCPMKKTIPAAQQPKCSGSYSLLAAALFSFSLLALWCNPGVDRPLWSEPLGRRQRWQALSSWVHVTSYYLFLLLMLLRLVDVSCI